MPACVGYLFPVIPGGYPSNTHKVSRFFKKKPHGSVMPCKVWPLKVEPVLHLSQVKCTVKPKAAGFTRIRVTEEPNVGMMQVKPTAKDFTKCKDQILISLFPLDTCSVLQDKIQKDSKYPPITWKKWGEFCGR
jgi:hypothetical protein